MGVNHLLKYGLYGDKAVDYQFFDKLPVLLAVSLPGCVVSSSEPVAWTWQVSQPPALGKTVQIKATFRLREIYTYAANNVTAKLILPEGIEKISGDTEWHGDLDHSTPHTLSVVVKAIRTGRFVISTEARFQNGLSYYVNPSHLYVIVTETGATTSTNQWPPSPAGRVPIYPPASPPKYK